MKKCIVTVLLSGWMGLAASTQALVLWTEPWEDGQNGLAHIDTDHSMEGGTRMKLGVDVPIRSSWSLCQVVPIHPTVATNGDTGKLTVTTNAVPPVRSRPADFGKHWVRTHPLTLAGWYSGDAFHYGDRMLFAKSGLNTVSDIFMPTASMHYYAGMTGLDKQGIAKVKATHPNLRGWIVYDEPGAALFPGIAEVISYLKENDPDNLIYVNLGGATGTPDSFRQYLDDAFTAMRPDVLCFTGQYPFRNGGSRFYPHHFASMIIMRDRALHYNVPYFVNVQAFEDLPNGYVLPTATEYRAEVYSYLTTGAKGIWNWMYEANHISRSLVSQGSPGVPSVPSALFPTAAAVNAEVKNLGRSLVYLQNSDVRFVPGGGNATPSGLQNWSVGAGTDQHILSITSNNGADGLVGFFRDDQSQPYFMLTNLKHGRGDSEANASGTFTIAFDPSIGRIFRLNRATGAIDVIGLLNHTLTKYTLNGGHGDLFNYSGNFAGIRKR